VNEAVNYDAAAEHGLGAEEYDQIIDALGRIPNDTELGIFSVMWSEHCSYKSSKKWLKTLPTEAPWVICGPGENAGIVDIGDGQAAIFKMESHNHPSFIEPYQGAATGVGGILRDVFTMGARPIANMNALRFGSPDHPKTRHLVSGVVAGIGGYGNCIGVPTVGGEVNFHPGYNGNILVNAMTVGLVDTDRIFYSAAAGTGNPVVYVGSKTGRDGIHGATMASAEFSDDAEEKRPTVQVGDPFTEKLLVEACLELMAEDAIVAIQDMGAAGLTSSSVEMASKGQVGIELHIDQIPTRETGMTPYEIMLSESQERMLMVIRPDREDLARKIFAKWDLDFSIIGKVTDDARYVLRNHGEVVTDIPLEVLEIVPEYDRPWTPAAARPTVAPDTVEAHDPVQALVTLMGSPDLCSRRWVWQQYDYSVMADTVQSPGGDAAVVRVHGTNKGLAVTTDCSPRYCSADARTGGQQAVAEAWRNLTAVGAQPLAITDCLNFGNPERPEIMGQFVNAIQGMGDACRALDFPVVSGNVSLYNETSGEAIPPTPAVGAVGLIDDLDQMTTVALKNEGDHVLLIGDTVGHLGASLYLRELTGSEEGAPPPVDLETEKRTGNLVRALIRGIHVNGCHDLSDGGLLIGIAEMALAGGVGATLDPLPSDVPAHAYLFGEDQARYLVTAPPENAEIVAKMASDAGITATRVGVAGGTELTVDANHSISIDEITAVHEGWLPDYMSAT
jgi:phosphoribosylformylglycinamidine synthase subunit PurL